MVAFLFNQAIALEALGITTNCPFVFLFDLVFGELVLIFVHRIEVDLRYYGTLGVRIPALNHAEYLWMNFERQF